MVVVDSLGASPEVLDEAKKIASKKTGLRTDRMLICSTHTHSGPPSNTKAGPAPAVAYRKVLAGGLAESIVSGVRRIAAGVGGSGVASFARGSIQPPLVPEAWEDAHPIPLENSDVVKMNPPRSPDVLDRPAGPTDPEITVISLQDARRKPLALFANYSLHYVGAVPRGQLSADYFGEFARLMPSRLRAGKNFVAMMSNGTSGDINNIPFTVTRPPREAV